MSQSAVTDFPYVRRHFALRNRFGKLPISYGSRSGSSGSTGSRSVTSLPIAWPTSPSANASLYESADVYPTSSSGWGDDFSTAFVADAEVLPAEEFMRTGDSQLEPSLGGAATTLLPMVDQATSRAYSHAMTRTLNALIESAKDERFEDGIESNLSSGIRVLFRNYSEAFARVIEDRLDQRNIAPRVVTEILHTIGDIDDESTLDWRFAMLVGNLRSPSILIRDAAAVGLSYLDDVRAEPYLRKAMEQETNKEFREDLASILEQLGA